MHSSKLWIIFTGVLLVVGALLAYPRFAPAQYDEFAQCLGDKGVTFFGAFWCPHCQEQKRMFGSSAKNLPYVECSTADRRGQVQVCIDEDVTSYPTWEFADGSRQSGVLSLVQLSARSGCALP